MHVFTEISILIVIATGVSLIMRALRQPLIIGNILTGLIVGPSVLGLVKTPETIEVFASFGIALLLFLVGLGLNPKEIKEVGKVSLITGLGQVVFTSVIGFALVMALGYDAVTAFYVSVALTFSSTIIILKLLTDKREQNKLYGRISIGFLLVQDLIATFALMAASASGQGNLSYSELLLLLAKGAAIISGLYLFVTLVLKRINLFLSRSQEILFLFAIAWGLGIASLTYEAGFSLEVGALFAGVALSTMPYAQEVSSRLRPLRDFFIIVFFIALGSKLGLDSVGPVIWQAIGLSAFVLIGNPIIVMVIMGLLGYKKKTGFKAGLTVAQISEFSLIFILIGLRNGQISDQVASMVTVVGIITIAVSSYMIIYADSLYAFFEKYLAVFERKNTKRETSSRKVYDAVLFGYLHGGSEFVRVLQQMSSKFLVIDYDPEAISRLQKKHIDCLYGDATDHELLQEAGLDKARLVISNISDHETNTLLVRIVQGMNPEAVVICHAENTKEAEELYDLGAGYVMMPHHIGSETIGAFIMRKGFSQEEFRRLRDKHRKSLQQKHHPAVKDTEVNS